MKRWLFRFVIGCAFALPLWMVSVALAQGEAPPALPAPASECRECHASFEGALLSGAHGPDAAQAFISKWTAQGRPEACLDCHTTEGLTCQTCHSETPDHPLLPSTTNRSSEKCGECHAATYLGWQVSAHGREDMPCVACHDPHAAGKEMKGDVSMLCANCHQSEDDHFAHTAHIPVGLTCGECHLTHPAAPADPHTMRDHSFDVKIETCDACHTSEKLLIAAVDAQPTVTPIPVDPMTSSLTVSVSETPPPVSPLGFAMLSIVVGFGAGIVVAPWMERWVKRNGHRLLQ